MTGDALLPTPARRGRLLVATPPLEDPNFDRTVIYVLEHSAQGAIGVVLNRPLDEECPTVLSSWSWHLSAPRVLFAGGPVEPDALIGLAFAEGVDAERWSPVDRGIASDGPTDDRAVTGEWAVGSVDLAESPEEVAEQLGAVRIFRGYAGWGPGQLDGELDAGAWMVFDATHDDLFGDRPDDLWRDVVRRQGGHFSWIAEAPDDLHRN